MKINWILISLSVLVLTSCASVEYREPIELSQEEIKDIKVKSANGSESKIGAYQFSDCSYKRMGFSESCAQIICKEDLKQPTGLSCGLYVPVK